MNLAIQLQNTFLYSSVSIALMVVFVMAYTAITPYWEIALIKQGRRTAALSLGGAMIGFAIPLAVVISHSVSIVDLAIWAVVAGVLQLLIFGICAVILRPISEQMDLNNQAAGTFIGAAAIAGGVINAGCLVP